MKRSLVSLAASVAAGGAQAQRPVSLFGAISSPLPQIHWEHQGEHLADKAYAQAFEALVKQLDAVASPAAALPTGRVDFSAAPAMLRREPVPRAGWVYIDELGKRAT